jgi:hypothetical protein
VSTAKKVSMALMGNKSGKKSGNSITTESAGFMDKTIRGLNAADRRHRRRYCDADFCFGCGMLRSQCECWDSVNQL